MLINNNEYISVVNDIKARIRAAQRRVLLTANSELFSLYWNIGRVINEYSVWGNKFVENLARDIKLDFPDARGYSVRNLKYMAKFAKTFSDFEIVQTLSAQLTWSHNVALLDKVKPVKSLFGMRNAAVNRVGRLTRLKSKSKTIYTSGRR